MNFKPIIHTKYLRIYNTSITFGIGLYVVAEIFVINIQIGTLQISIGAYE